MSTSTATPTTASSSATSTTTNGCVSAIPDHYGRVPQGACDSYYNYDPNFPAAVAVAVILGILTMIHVTQAILYKRRFCAVLIIGALWEAGAFTVRAIGAHDQQQLSFVIVSQALLFLAPLWINAYAYMMLGRMVHYFLPEKRLFNVRAPLLARCFVGLDIISFLVQGAGVSMISPNASYSRMMNGIHIYMGGIGLQQLFIVIFLVLVVSFQRRMTSIASSNRIAVKSGWRSLTWTLYVVLALITVRIIFRLVEYADGVDHSNPLPNVEAYIYCLDALPMILAIALLNIVHAGRILVGPDSVFPKLSRAEKKAKRQEKKNKKMQRKEDKRAENLNGSNDSFAQSPEREGDAYQMA